MELYRRHSPDCKHADKGVAYTKCSCPIWCHVKIRGKWRKKSLKTRDWQRAIKRLDSVHDTPEPAPAERTVADAIAAYLADCRARGLQPSTLVSYTNTFEPLAEYLKPDAPIAGVSPANLTRYRAARKVSLNSQRKELEQIRSLFWFCVHQHWITDNPAKKIKPPKPDNLPTLPYSRDEVKALLAACEEITNFNADSLPRTRSRARALVMLLLYSGFRVSDAVLLERKRIAPNGRLLVRMMKTGNPLYVKLPADCLEALSALPVESEYFFWSGVADLDTAKKSARRTIACLGRMCKINAHPHRFRDTFAVELLLKGVDIRTVSLLLGHKSIKTTESHYAPFVAGFQTMLDDALGKLSFG